MWLSFKESPLSSEHGDITDRLLARTSYPPGMSETMPEEPSQSDPKKSARRSARFAEMMNSPTRRPTPLGTDTAWALKLKDAVDTAVRELHVQVLSAKPLRMYDADNPNDMLIELDTDKGRLQAIRSRAGV